jgi:hypothetical protein
MLTYFYSKQKKKKKRKKKNKKSRCTKENVYLGRTEQVQTTPYYIFSDIKTFLTQTLFRKMSRKTPYPKEKYVPLFCM